MLAADDIDGIYKYGFGRTDGDLCKIGVLASSNQSMCAANAQTSCMSLAYLFPPVSHYPHD